MATSLRKIVFTFICRVPIGQKEVIDRNLSKLSEFKQPETAEGMAFHTGRVHQFMWGYLKTIPIDLGDKVGKTEISSYQLEVPEVYVIEFDVNLNQESVKRIRKLRDGTRRNELRRLREAFKKLFLEGIISSESEKPIPHRDVISLSLYGFKIKKASELLGSDVSTWKDIEHLSKAFRSNPILLSISPNIETGLMSVKSLYQNRITLLVQEGYPLNFLTGEFNFRDLAIVDFWDQIEHTDRPIWYSPLFPGGMPPFGSVSMGDLAYLIIFFQWLKEELNETYRQQRRIRGLEDEVNDRLSKRKLEECFVATSRIFKARGDFKQIPNYPTI